MLESAKYSEENPDLTFMPKDESQEYDAMESQFRRLQTSMKCLHSKFLLDRDTTKCYGQICLDIYKVFVKRIGGTPKMAQISGWKDLAACLGVSNDDMNYIDHGMKDSPTETILKVFAQGEDATMDKLISALIQIKRYDVLVGIQHLLLELHEMILHVSEDVGYSTSSWISGDYKQVSIFHPGIIPMDLPEVLRSPNIDNESSNSSDDALDINNQRDFCESSKPFLLLTYSADGNQCAKNIIKVIESNNNLDINVATLERYKTKLYENPEHMISTLFEKARFVIPILTRGYMEQIRSTDVAVPSSMDDLDNAYVRFVYTLMTNQYISSTGCLNKKVRTILPACANRHILTELYKNPVLQVWTAESDLEKLLNNILK